MATKKPDDLDTETTFADMNVDGFRWYDKSKKNGTKNKEKIYVTRKEYWAMVKGAFLAIAPFVLGIGIFFMLIYILCYFWLM